MGRRSAGVRQRHGTGRRVRRYVAAGLAWGVDAALGEGQLGDELLAAVAERVRPHRGDGHGPAWALLAAHHDQFKAMVVDDGLTVVRAGELLARRGVVVPERTLHRYALEVLEHGRGSPRSTVPVADCEPGAECQVDFGRMGLIDDPAAGRRRVVHALIFTAVYSRHMFVHLSFGQDLPAVIAGCEAAWTFFGGVFTVMIPDNMAPIVDRADALEPRPGVRRVRPAPRVRGRPGPDPLAAGQTAGRARRPVRARQLLRRGVLPGRAARRAARA